ncbi:MAG: hypothetical protein M1482_12710 [Chloroflexi bacterium]|nr:hypothetical protein [Chloroflexota bacterium]
MSYYIRLPDGTWVDVASTVTTSSGGVNQGDGSEGGGGGGSGPGPSAQGNWQPPPPPKPLLSPLMQPAATGKVTAPPDFASLGYQPQFNLNFHVLPPGGKQDDASDKSGTKGQVGSLGADGANNGGVATNPANEAILARLRQGMAYANLMQRDRNQLRIMQRLMFGAMNANTDGADLNDPEVMFGLYRDAVKATPFNLGRPIPGAFHGGSRSGGRRGGGSHTGPPANPSAEPPAESVETKLSPFGNPAAGRLIFGENDLGALPADARMYVDGMMRALGYSPTGVAGQYGAKEYVKAGGGMSIENYLATISDLRLRAWLAWLAGQKGLSASQANYPGDSKWFNGVVTAPQQPPEPEVPAGTITEPAA